jgi:hypothetical protein
MNTAATRTAENIGHEAFVNRVFRLDCQQRKDNPAAERCPTHKNILAVKLDSSLYCADTKARTCDYVKMGVVDPDYRR